VRDARYTATMKAVANLLLLKTWVYSPIVHCHPLSLNYSLPPEFEYWQEYAFVMISRARKLLVLQLDGWKESVGIRAEMQHAHKCFIPVEFIEP
jgi:hypothetical protein